MGKRAKRCFSDVDLFYELEELGEGDRVSVDVIFEVLLRLLAEKLGIQRDEEGYFQTREQFEAEEET